MSRKRFTEEFKIEAVRQITDEGLQSGTLQNDWGYRPTACMLGLSSFGSRPRNASATVSGCRDQAPASSAQTGH